MAESLNNVLFSMQSVSIFAYQHVKHAAQAVCTRRKLHICKETEMNWAFEFVLVYNNLGENIASLN